MKAITITAAGSPDNLKITEIDEPELKDGEIKIEVKAFGINRAETYFRAGNFGDVEKGRVPGIEAAGIVIEDPTETFTPGQKVITAMGGLMLSKNGSYAEIVAANVNQVLAITSDISFVQLASLPMAYLTAWGALDKSMHINKGDTLLIRGATSSLGMAAVCYAKAKGLSVIATTRKPENEERLKDMGADYILIDEGEIADQVLSIFPSGIDGVLEVVGASTVKDSAKVLKRWGELVVVGILSGSPIIEQLNLMSDLPMTVKLSFFGSGLFGTENLPLDTSSLNWVAEQVHQKNMPDITSHIFNFEDISKAHIQMESDEALGKLVVSV